MDISKRDEKFEEKQKLQKNLKEAFGRMLGVSSVAPIASDSNSAVKNRSKLASRQGVNSYPSQAFKEQEEESDVAAEEPVLDEPVDDMAPEGDEMAPEGDMDVAVDSDADMVDDAAEDADGASEQKMAADRVVQKYFNQLPSDVVLDADDEGIVFTEFHDDMEGPFKVLVFPADKSIAEVAEVKEPADADSALDVEEPEDELAAEEPVDELEPEGGDLEGLGGGEEEPEGEVAPEEEPAPEEEEEPVMEAEFSKGSKDGVVKPKIEGEEESAKLNASPVLEEGVEMEKGAKDGIEDPTQTGSTDDNNTRATHLSPQCESEECEDDDDKEELTEEDNEECDEEEDEEEVINEVDKEEVIRESVRDRRLRKKGLIGNDRDPEAEEAEKEAERDPMRYGRNDWQKMLESRRRSK